MALMMDSGLDPSGDLGEIQFLKRHDKVVKAVIEGNADVGATYNDARMEEFNTKTEANSELPIITRTKPIPTSPITVSEKFSRNHPELVEKFVNVMTNLHNSEKGREILKTLGISQYQPAENSDYDQVREVLRQLRTTLPRVQNICQKPLSG
jgi:phosphonate transport system substrate-binding protein